MSKRSSLFSKLVELSHLKLQEQISDMRKSNHPMAMGSVESRSLKTNPDIDSSMHGFKPKLSLVPDTSKLLMYLRDPVIAAIIQTRCNQIAEFAAVQPDKYSSGFKFVRKDNKDIAKEDNEHIEKLNDFIINCGLLDEERIENDERMGFEEFLRRIIKDRLLYDQMSIERIQTRSGHLHHFLPTSSATIRKATDNLIPEMIHDATSDIEYPDVDKLKHVQVVAGQIKRAFTDKEMIVIFGNPVNDFFTNGYSLGELDLLMSVITAHLNADKRNRAASENGFVSQGIINLKGEVDEEQLESFRRGFYTMASGSNAMYRVPIMNAVDGMEFIKTGMTDSDMEYGKYMDYLIKMMCAVFQIAPEEINFSSSSSDGKNTNNYNNLEKRLKMSKDKGIRPILRSIEAIVNQHLVPNLREDWVKEYKFIFAGLEKEDREEEVGRLEKEVKIYKTVNECRMEQGLPPLNELGDIILDGNWVAMYTQFSEQAQKINAQAMQSEELDVGGVEDDNTDAIDGVNNTPEIDTPFDKSIKIEYYENGDEDKE